ncbi:MAG: AmmeMemoRadiSam system protein B [Patescibacteria group bacterium]
MLIFSAITPHPPILIPTIGKENLDVIKKTKQAMEKLSGDLYAVKPDTIIIFTPHGEIHKNKMTINQSPVLKASLAEFGDLVTKLEWQGNLGMSYQIYEHFETKDVIRLIQEEEVDHGISVPLSYLSQGLKDTKIIPISYSGVDLKTHFSFGKDLSDLIKKSNERIAVIASGDLSHSLTEDSPAGYTPEGKKFDKQLIKLIEEKKYDKILKIDDEFIKKAGECGVRSIAMLLGVIDEIDLQPNILSYEGPFGVGYLVAEFV